MSDDQNIVFQGKRFHVSRVQRINPDGVSRSCEFIRHPGSVALLPVLNDGRICLIRNHRVTVNDTLVEVPAGTREPNEPPHITAARELTEETGYTAGRLEKITSIFPAPGILDEEMYLFLASDLVEGEPQREPNEEIENFVVDLPTALGMVGDGRIRDAKTIIALLLYRDR